MLQPMLARFKMLKAFVQKLEHLVSISRQCTSSKQATEDLTQLAFNLTLERGFHKVAWPKGRAMASDSIHQPLERYKNDLQAWAVLNELVYDYLTIVKQQAPFTDVMYLIGYQSKSLSKALGQFLTPPQVAQGVVGMLGMGKMDELTEGKHIRVGDPCGSGAGSLLLAFLAEAHRVQPTRTNQIHLMAVDIDYRMVMMTSVQIALASIIHHIPIGSLRVYCANSIIVYCSYAYGKTDKLDYLYFTDEVNLIALRNQDAAKSAISEMEPS